MYCEGVKGECNLGQQEIAFRYAEALETADHHTIYKNGAKEIAEQHGKSLTFMAKFNEREGNSCHIHLSVRGEDGTPVMAGDGEYGFSPFMEHWIAGILATLREFTLLYAPDDQLVQALREGQFAPTGVAWGLDNRTCALRVVGHGPVAARREPGARRRRQPVPRDRRRSSPAACTASRTSCRCPSRCAGNAYASDVDHAADDAARGGAAVRASPTIARAAFGDDMVEHYLNQARIEVEAYDAAVTDWERVRGFERL